MSERATSAVTDDGGAAVGSADGPDVAPTLEDPVARGASRVFGGPLGRRAARVPRRWLIPPVVLALFTIGTCFAGWVQKLPCRDPANWTHEYQYTRLCYSDVEALYYSEGLVGNRNTSTGAGSRLEVPYRDHEVEYPVVIGGLMWLAAEGANLVHPHDPNGGHSDRRPQSFFDFTALILTGAAVVAVVATALTHRRRPWDAALVALAPALFIHAFTNWDLAATAFAALAVYAWSRRRPGWAGVWLGLGIATKLYPVLFLIPLLALCLRAGRMRAWLQTTGTAVLTVALVYLPVLLFTPVFGQDPRGSGSRVPVAPSVWQVLRHGGGWSGVRRALAGIPLIGSGIAGNCSAQNGLLRFFQLNRTRPADFDSLYYGAQQAHIGSTALFPTESLTTPCAAPAKLNAFVAVLTVVMLLGVVALIFFVARRPRLPQVLFVTIALFLLVNKVDSPQYVIWLLPLAALARPRWPAFLAWQATEVLVLLARFPYLISIDRAQAGKSAQGIGYWWFFSAIALRDIALLVLVVLVIREIIRPDLDVVRRDGSDDPAGGVLDGVSDSLVLAPIFGVGTAAGTADTPVAVPTGSPWAAPPARFAAARPPPPVCT